MRRRRRSNNIAAGNLDSLLDTMTNVVGILVIVLIMTQVNVADAIRRLRSGLPEVSPQQMEQLVETASRADEELALLRSPEGDFDPARVATAQAQIGLLTVELEKELKVAKPKSELVQLVADRDAALETVKQANMTAREKRAGLRSELDSAKALAGRPPVRVRLPNPRAAREDSSEVALFACVGDRVYTIDVPALQARAKAAIESGGRKLIHSIEGTGDKRRTIYKRKQCEDFLADGKTGDAMVSLSLRTYPDRPYATLIIKPRPDGGQPISEVRASDRGKIRQTMQKASLARDYLFFYVAADAFATYLEARRIAEVDHNLPVGWEFTDQNLLLYKGAPGLRFEHTPKPVDPTAKPPPPRPPPTKPEVLD